MTLLDLIIIGVLVFFIVTRFTSDSIIKKDDKKSKKDKIRDSIEIKVIKGSAQTKDQIEKIFQKAREMSEIESKKQEDKESLDGITRIKAYDTRFTEKNFLKGAKSAFNWFYECLNKDDDEKLEKFVSPKIFSEMISWLNNLDKKDQKVFIDIEFLKEPEIVDCRTVARTAFIDVIYNINLKTTIKGKKSKKIESKETKKQSVVWTWAKNIESTDPNWQLEEMKNVS
ncbi:MAG: TIM44-like domain-containing protein [Proteobacteria bacterium]|nr:TIM44-like domain-containing protein [Pseudomonadota bacterium]